MSSLFSKRNLVKYFMPGCFGAFLSIIGYPYYTWQFYPCLLSWIIAVETFDHILLSDNNVAQI
jgi:hypothetical protein